MQVVPLMRRGDGGSVEPRLVLCCVGGSAAATVEPAGRILRRALLAPRVCAPLLRPLRAFGVLVGGEKQ